ncbi:DUF742 domain-containing protein [Nocardioides sp. LHG3406-4]|uniref:DUF742 domain-containing protein n=1 Tax=Nocardioides sp. LHG3406-4 TaxID=2804575 RepID=UPI003CF8F670
MAPDERAGDQVVSPARFIRPYTITAGRTRATVDLPLEATLRRQPRDVEADLSPGALRILTVCDTRSVAEVSALVAMPIGVARVLLSDLVEQGFVQVQATITESSSKDERIELIERTLRGLRAF